MESVLGATPHEFESRILRHCSHRAIRRRAPPLAVGPFDGSQSSLCWFLSTGCVSGVPQLATAVSRATSSSMASDTQVPRPHARGRSRFPPHDLVGDAGWDTKQHENGGGRVPGSAQPAVPHLRGFKQPLLVVIVRVRAQQATARLGEHVVRLGPQVAGRLAFALLRLAVGIEHGDQRRPAGALVWRPARNVTWCSWSRAGPAPCPGNAPFPPGRTVRHPHTLLVPGAQTTPAQLLDTRCRGRRQTRAVQQSRSVADRLGVLQV